MTYAPRDQEIDRVKAAVLRYDQTLRGVDQGERASGGCCGSCKGGLWFHNLSRKKVRASMWLAILLRKRGRPEDFALAHSIDLDAWP